MDATEQLGKVRSTQYRLTKIRWMTFSVKPPIEREMECYLLSLDVLERGLKLGTVLDIVAFRESVKTGAHALPGACNYPIFLSRRFHRPVYFLFEFISNYDPHRNLRDQLQSQARTDVDVFT